MTPTPVHRFRSVLPAALLAGALLVGCGGDDGPETTAMTPAEIAEETGAVETPVKSEDVGSGEPGERVGTLEFFVPETVEAPAGYVTLANACDPEGNDAYGAFIRYAVPEDWSVSGRGSAGSGDDLSGNVDHEFTTSGGEVWIALDRDSRDDQDQILNGSREVSESLDYTYSVGDEETQVVHREAFTTSINGEDHTVWTVSDGSDLSAGEDAVYRVRVVAYHMTWPAEGSLTASFVMELIGDPAVLDDETARTIVETIQIPECVRDRVLVTKEVTVSTDLNGDGHVSTADDLRTALAG